LGKGTGAKLISPVGHQAVFLEREKKQNGGKAGSKNFEDRVGNQKC
jgi:hypothetical protein